MSLPEVNSVVNNIALDKKVIRQHLKIILTNVRKLLHTALMFAILSLVLLILQSWLIANLFSYVLMTHLNKVDFNYNISLYYIIVIAFCFITRPILQYIQDRYTHSASFLARQELRTKLISIISRLGPACRVFGSDGVLSSKLTDQIDALDDYISRYYVQVLLVGLTPILILAVVLFYSKVATIIFTITMPLIIVFMVLVGTTTADKSRAQFEALNRLSGYFLDLVRGMKTIVHFDAMQHAQQVIQDTSDQYRKGTMDILKLAFLSIGTLEFFSSIAMAMIALYLGLGVMGEIPGYQHIIMVAYQPALFILLVAAEFYMPLRKLGSDYHSKAAAEGAMADIIPILLAHNAWVHSGKERIYLTEAPMLIAQDLSIYSEDGVVRLQPISFQINKQERVWIKGASGTGKTSLFEAILTFIPYVGNLAINHIPLNNIKRDNWHEQISYLSQSTRMINASIADNLRLASPNTSDEELMQVLQQVDLLDFILQLPHGLHTCLGERGLGLSGGQIGRLSIAQLLLKDAWLWLIDEPTEHLDLETTELILTLLEKVTRNKTVLLISHQENFLNWLDRTIVVCDAE